MMPLFEEHDMNAVGAWEMLIGREMPTFFYMLEWRDLAHREHAFAEFYGDPRVEAMREMTIREAGGDLLRDFDVAILQPATYLPPSFGSQSSRDGRS